MKVSKYASMPLLFIEQTIKDFPEAAMQYHYITNGKDVAGPIPQEDEVNFLQMEVLEKITHLRSLMEKLPKVVCIIKTGDQEYRGKIKRITDQFIELQSSGKTTELVVSEIEDIQIISF